MVRGWARWGRGGWVGGERHVGGLGGTIRAVSAFGGSEKGGTPYGIVFPNIRNKHCSDV